MFTTLTRIIRYGFQSFWRNRWLSVATVSIMLLTLLVFQGLIFLRVVTSSGIDALKDKIDISIYFNVSTDEETILNVRKKLEKNERIKVVEYISREKALALFKERHVDDPTINLALKELEDNPLSASLNIKAHNPSEYTAIARYIDAQKEWESLIEKMTYRQNEVVISRLAKVVDTTEKFGFALTFFLALAAIFITFNTISLTIYSNRTEIGVMRLVGSSSYFIIGPYIVAGVLYALLAAVLSMLLTWPLLSLGAPYIKFLLPDTDIYQYFQDHLVRLFMYQALFGIVIGVVSARMAAGKYIKV